DKEDNVLKHAPHTASVITADVWERPYSRQKAAYPLPYVRDAKFWPSVSRVDNAYGDRNLVCSCLPLALYEKTESVPAYSFTMLFACLKVSSRVSKELFFPKPSFFSTFALWKL